MKKYSFIIILIFSFLFLSGFQNNSILYDTTDDFIVFALDIGESQVKQMLYFSLDEDKIISLSNEKDFEIFKQNLKEEIVEIRNNFLFNYALTYLQNPIEEFKINKGVLLSDVTYNSDQKVIGFSVVFSSLQAWSYYNSNGNNSSSNVPSEGNIFYNKKISNGKFIFSNKSTMNGEEKTIGEIYAQKFINSSKGLSFESYIKNNYKPSFIYSYSTVFDKIKSNANYQFSNNNIFYHIWTVEFENINDENLVSIYLLIINYGWWYVFAIFITLLFILLSFLIIKIKKNRKKRSP